MLARTLRALAFGAALASSGVAAQPAQTQVQRGEYLARAGDCVSCHTAKGGAPFAGGTRLDTPFGYMLAPNITPDLATGIGRWSADDFERAVRHGVNKQGKDMYPTMPYDFYTRVTREDIDAIFAYLRTVAPVRNVVDVNHLKFPFDVRATMAVWRELYFKEGVYRPNPAKSAAWNRGGYLVEGLGHCSDCHSPRNLLGGIEKSKDFDGAVVDGWFALDLTSDLVTGLGAWTTDDIATYLKTGSYKGKTTTLGPMAEVVQNSMRYMTDADLQAIAEYLKSIPPESGLRTGRTGPGSDESQWGKALPRQLQRMPSGQWPRSAQRVSAARGQWRRAGPRSCQYHQGGQPGNSAAWRVHPHAEFRRAADRSAGRRNRQLRAHELGQYCGAQRDPRHGRQPARESQLNLPDRSCN